MVKLNGAQLWDAWENHPDLLAYVARLAVEEWGKPWPKEPWNQPDLQVYTEGEYVIAEVVE